MRALCQLAALLPLATGRLTLEGMLHIQHVDGAVMNPLCCALPLTGYELFAANELVTEFDEWARGHRYSFSDPEEYRKRLHIFRQNVALIAHHAANREKSYTLGLTKFAHMTAKELADGTRCVLQPMLLVPVCCLWAFVRLTRSCYSAIDSTAHACRHPDCQAAATPDEDLREGPTGNSDLPPQVLTHSLKPACFDFLETNGLSVNPLIRKAARGNPLENFLKSQYSHARPTSPHTKTYQVRCTHTPYPWKYASQVQG
jgi:hypothetical protein